MKTSTTPQVCNGNAPSSLVSHKRGAGAGMGVGMLRGRGIPLNENPPTHPGVERVRLPWNLFSCCPFNEPETWLKTHGIVNEHFENHENTDFLTISWKQ